jgi:hypothetical protein
LCHQVLSQRIEQRLCDHDTCVTDPERTHGPRPYTGIMASIDAMNWREFEHHIAALLAPRRLHGRRRARRPR